jgi:hypothetical protein
MSRRSVHRIGFFCIAIIMSAGLCALLLSPRLMAASKTTSKRDSSFSSEIYTELISRTVVDESELADQLALDLIYNGPLLPPVSDFYTSLNLGVVPYGAITFPAWIFEKGQTVFTHGVPSYDLALSIDFST